MSKQLRVLFFTLFSVFAFISHAQITTFTFTGAVQYYTVPAGVTSVQIECWGAQGGDEIGLDLVPAPGGLGGYSIGELAVVPGQVLEVYVGGAGAPFGAGGFNGGGQAATNYGSAGGGASDVRVGAYAFADRVIVAGGGGGGAFGSYGNAGGHGGGTVGGTGSSGGGFTAGTGGTQVAGGAAGCCYGAAIGGTFGLGASPGDYHNAGGGGGWYGGGSGAGHAGAGGGSSYIDGVTSGSTTEGVRSGDGEVIIEVLCAGLEVEPVEEIICEGESIILDASSTTGGVITWDGGVVNGVSFTPPVGITTYTATSTSPEDCEFTIDIEVVVMPTVTITVDTDEVCDGETIILTEGDDAVTYTWDPIDIVSGAPYEPLGGPGTYTYTLTGAVGSCENTATIDITVLDLPVVTAAVDFDEICLGEEVIFTGSGADSYTWDMGVTDGVPFVPGAYGIETYTVTGTDAATGCENTASVDVNVLDAPAVTATADDTEVCEGDEVTLTGGGAVTYIWDGGVLDGVPFTPGLGTTTYTVTGSTVSGCENTATIDITVNPFPIVTATADVVEICEGEEVTLTGMGADTYVWDMGVTDGVAFTPAGVGTITYTVIGTSGGCDGTASIDILVNPVPTVTATASPMIICEGESITFSGSGADTYSWDGGVTNGVPFTPPGIGTFDFNVVGTMAGTGCENAAMVTVTINEKPIVGISAITSEICFGESLTLNGTGADSYSWTGGIANGVPFTPGAVGSFPYTVTGTNGFGCSSSATITITVIDCEPVVPLFDIPEVLCVGDCIEIIDRSTGVVATWEWDFGGAVVPNTSTEQNPEICVMTAGTYTVELTTTSATLAVSSVSHTINVYDNPIMYALNDTIIDLGGEATLLAATMSIGDFIWTPDDNVECDDCQLTIASPEQSTTYTVNLIDEHGCTATDTVMVLVNFVEGVGVPSAFSPNGDGNNDVLFVKGYALESVSFTVYNRYGEVVFFTTDQNIGWDGTFKDREENPGVFTWVLQYQFINGQSGFQKGNTTLIR